MFALNENMKKILQHTILIEDSESENIKQL